MSTPKNVITPTRVRVGNDVHICLAGTDIGGTKVSKDFKPTDESGEYQYIGKCIDFQHQYETEDDPITYFDPEVNGWVTEKNTTVTSDTIVFNMVEVSQVFWDIVFRPQDTLVSKKDNVPFSRDEPGVLCWLKTRKYDKQNSDLLLLEVYGRLTAESPTENNKLTKPQYTLEVIKSSLAVLTPEDSSGYAEASES